MYYQKYALVLKKWRDMIPLVKYADVIEDAIMLQFPNAENIMIKSNYYSFETPKLPRRGELAAIGRFISYNSPLLNNIVVQYNSKSGEHLPARKLFRCIEKNYPVKKRIKKEWDGYVRFGFPVLALAKIGYHMNFKYNSR